MEPTINGDETMADGPGVLLIGKHQMIMLGEVVLLRVLIEHGRLFL